MTEPNSEGWPVPGLELEFPPRPEYVRTVRHAIAALARVHDVPDDVIEEVKLAVSEAATSAVANAIGEAERGDDRDGAEPVRVTASLDESRFLVDLFDPSGTAPREVSGHPTEIDTADIPLDRELSLPIIRGLVDEVAITPREGGGFRLRMVVGLDREDE